MNGVGPMRFLLVAVCLTALISPAVAQVSPLGGATGNPAVVQGPGPGTGTVRTPGRARGGRTLQERFEAANTAHDGRLTQAQAAPMPAVARNFDAIDIGRKGYVTIDEIRSYNRAKRAERKAERSGARQ